MSESNESNGGGKRERPEEESDSEPPGKALKIQTTLQQEQEQSNTLTTEDAQGPEPPVQSPNEVNLSNDSQTAQNVMTTGSSAPQSNAKPPPVVNDPRKATTSVHALSLSTLTPKAQAATTNTNQIIEEKGEVSSLYVGRVIGKGGEMIRDLQARSGARIDVDQNVPPGHPRVITYKGTPQTVEFAKKLVAILSREGASESDLPLGHASMEQLVIPAQSVGKIIGRGGEMIRELQSRSQAKIQIDHSGRSGQPADQKMVTITGTQESTAKAKEMVNFLVSNPMMDAQHSLNMLIEDKARSGLPWGTGPPYPNLPSQGRGMTPQLGHQNSNFSLGPVGGNYQHTTVDGQSFHTQSAFGPAPPNMFPAQPNYAGHNSIYTNGHGGSDVEIFFAAKQFMGRIIGSKGITVNDLQKRSGCEIQINQDVPPGQDCEITIKGPRSGIESAKQMLRDIIETGPQHPYAGGADTYGGGLSNYNQQQHQQNMPARINPQQYSYQQNHENHYQQPYGQPQPQLQSPAVFGHGQLPPSVYGNYDPSRQVFSTYPQQSAPFSQFQLPHSAPLPVVKSPPPIPLLWKAATSPEGQIYYYNERTGETQWERPAGMP
jgi:rRNA processing protein Krr1/Pno1